MYVEGTFGIGAGVFLAPPPESCLGPPLSPSSWLCMQTCRQTDRHSSRQPGSQTDRKAARQTDRQADQGERAKTEADTDKVRGAESCLSLLLSLG